MKPEREAEIREWYATDSIFLGPHLIGELLDALVELRAELQTSLTMTQVCIKMKSDSEIENKNLKAENESLSSDLKKKEGEIGRAEHRGNTVDYIYDKLNVYGKFIDDLRVMNEKLRARIETILELVQEHAEGGNIENYRYLSERLEEAAK